MRQEVKMAELLLPSLPNQEASDTFYEAVWEADSSVMSTQIDLIKSKIEVTLADSFLTIKKKEVRPANLPGSFLLSCLVTL